MASNLHDVTEEVPMVAGGADVSADDVGSIASKLNAAAGSGETAEVLRLIADGADVSAANENGLTPLHMAAAKSHFAVLRILLDARASASDDGDLGGDLTPLMMACIFGNEEAAQQLVDAGVSVRCSAKLNGFTALHHAAYEGYPKPQTLNPKPSTLNPKH